MEDALRKKIDIPHALVALGVWLTSLIVYALTVAPTFSFWDCGEFIATGYILGLPHPPGSPTYILLGRVFSLLPLASDIAVRINYLSVVCSSGTALFGYLTAARILRGWFGTDRSALSRLLIYAGSASGALFVAFSFTNWINSVEAEVYGLTMLLMTVMVWLTLKYADQRGTRAGDRTICLIFYLGFLGIGVHMSAFLVVPVAAIFFLLKKKAGAGVWFGTAIFVAFVLYLIFALSSRPGEIPYYLPVFIVLLIYLFYIFSFERVSSRMLVVGVGFVLSLLPLIGFILNRLAGTGSEQVLSESAMGAINAAGKVAFAVLIVWALYTLYRYFVQGRQLQQHRAELISSGFIIAAAVMTALLFTPKGYTSFLIITGAAAVILVVWLRHRIRWAAVIAVGGVSLVVIGVIPFFYGLGVAAGAVLLLGLARRSSEWKTALLVILCAATGYSVHIFIPIRSEQQPAINENNPSAGFEATVNFLERKQYGSQSMVERMFKRRAEWTNQFGDFHRMGFWHFFQDQFGLTGPRFVVLLLLGLFGIWEVIRRRAERGLSLLLLLLICTVGLVLYMNFSDGTRQHPVTGADYIEVRDRDYFFTPAFIFFGLVIGIGAAIAVQYIREASARFSAAPRRVIVTSSLVLFLLPVFALAGNYNRCDRSRNFFPLDYAFNLLDSAEPNAIMFTYGDNDTFPLWCAQEVYGIRRDVRVVNLSLANGKWYIKQVQNNMGVELGFSEEDIDRLRPYRSADGLVMRLQDQVIDAIMVNNFGRVPIHFAISVGSGARKFQGRSMDSLLVMSAMVWRVEEPGQPQRVDIEESWDFYTNPLRFRCRGANDPTIHQDATTFRLTRNWANGFVMTANALRRVDDTQRAEELMHRAVEKIPYSSRAVEYLANLYGEQGKVDELRTLVDRTTSGDRRRLKLLLGQAELNRKQYVPAEQLLRELLAEDPSYRPVFQELARLYIATSQALPLRSLLQRWLEDHPQDDQIRKMLQELDKAIIAHDSARGRDS
ncbi:MAG: DUF2723 domain-containing protein [bacterium]